MDNKEKIINFLQVLGVTKEEHIQRLFNEFNNNFKNILLSACSK